MVYVPLKVYVAKTNIGTSIYHFFQVSSTKTASNKVPNTTQVINPTPVTPYVYDSLLSWKIYIHRLIARLRISLVKWHL